MKFFIGIVPPPATRDRILNVQKSFPSNRVPFSTEPHITLIPPPLLSPDKVWLTKIFTEVAGFTRFQIRFEGINTFDNRILFLEPKTADELLNLYSKLVSSLNTEKSDYYPHLTLGKVSPEGMTHEELSEMKKKAETELYDIPPFQVDFVRIFQKNMALEPYQKLLDIPLKL